MVKNLEIKDFRPNTETQEYVHVLKSNLDRPKRESGAHLQNAMSHALILSYLRLNLMNGKSFGQTYPFKGPYHEKLFTVLCHPYKGRSYQL